MDSAFFLFRLLLGHALLNSLAIGDGSTAKTYSSVEEVHEIHPGEGGLYRPYGGYVSDWNKDWFLGGGGAGASGFSGGIRMSPGKCVDIPDNMTLCRGIGYDQMRLPNLLDHDSVKEATQQAGSWVPLFNLRCHPDTQVFLCSLFAPVCLDRPIWPCKTLCEAVKAGCEGRMMKYGFPWPEMLRCDKFPPDNDLCIGMRHDSKPDETLCPACEQPDTFENIVDNFCSAEFAIRIRLEGTEVSGSDLKLVTGKKKKAYKRGTLKSKDLRDTPFYIENGTRCKCKVTEELKSDSRNSANFLIMGTRKEDRLVLSFIERMDRRSTDMTKALDAIQKEKICRAGFQMITSDEVTKQGGKENQAEKKANEKKDDGLKGSVAKINGKKTSHKRGENKKGDRKKGEGKKGEGKKVDGKKGDGKKGDGKNGEEKTENGKRSSDARPDKDGKRRRQKESSSSTKKSLKLS